MARWVLLVLLAWSAGSCGLREFTPERAEVLLPSARSVTVERRLVLENGLRVLLVSNPLAERAGVSLSVGVGSLSDPAEHPGLAHFLEHMLFLGSQKYPQADGYNAFMARSGGRSNAYTAPDHTNYHFSVPHQALEEGLERLAQFFIAPLMDPDYTQREMQAVHSEHAKNVENDLWRGRQVLRTVFVRGHPAAKFSTGSLSTLGQVRREELLAFHRRHYTAGRMTLAIVGAAPLGRLETLARKEFSAIRAGGGEPLRFSPRLLASQKHLRELRIRPVKDTRSLTLYFALPPTRAHWRSRPLQLLGFVLGHEGQGSLLSLLKEEGLAHSLSAGSGGDETWDYASFAIHIGLTPQGLQERYQVAEYVLGALAGLRQQGLPRRLFRENQRLARLEQRYGEASSSLHQAVQLSAQMQRLPLWALPHAAQAFHEYRPGLLQSLLEQMRLPQLVMISAGPQLPVEHTERYYGARYALDLQSGPRYAALARAQPDPRWQLPRPNPFLPQAPAIPKPQGSTQLTQAGWLRLQNEGLMQPALDSLQPLIGQPLTLARARQLLAAAPATAGPARSASAPQPPPAAKAAPGQASSAALAPAEVLSRVAKVLQPAPQRIWEAPLGRLWRQPPWRLRSPQGVLRLQFLTPRASTTPHRAALAALHAALVQESMNELGYPMREAGLEYQFASSLQGIQVEVSGYAERLPQVLETLMRHAKAPQVAAEAFARVKRELLRELENRRLQQPYQQALAQRMVLLSPFVHGVPQRLAALRPLTLADVQRYARTLLARTYAQGVAGGALEAAAAKAALRQALALWQAKPLPPAERTIPYITPPPPGARQVHTQRLEVSNSSAVLHLHAGQDTPALRAVLNLAASALHQRYFAALRTRQQLGYLVFAGPGRLYQQLHLSFIAQSKDSSADLILERTEAFLPQFVRYVQGWRPAEFAQHRSSALERLLELPENIQEEARILFRQAFEQKEDFRRVSHSARALQALTQAQFQATLENLLHNPSRGTLALRFLGRQAPPPKPL